MRCLSEAGRRKLRRGVFGQWALLRVSARSPNHTQRCCQRYGKVNTYNSTNLGASQDREDYGQRMEFQPVSQRPRQVEIILDNSPRKQQCSHPNPMKIVGHADPGDQRRCAHPTDDRNKFKYSSENTQRDCVRESEDEQNRRIERQGKEAEKNLSPDIAGKDGVYLVDDHPGRLLMLLRKERFYSAFRDAISVAEQEEGQYRNQCQPSEDLCSLRK